MSPTVNKTLKCQIIGKIFSDGKTTSKAIAAFRDLKIPPEDLAEIVRFDDVQTDEGEYQKFHDAIRTWLALWANRGASQNQPEIMASAQNARSNTSCPTQQ
jgi:hypothetical protein